MTTRRSKRRADSNPPEDEPETKRKEISLTNVSLPLIGTASWTIPKLALKHFPSSGSHLIRYSGVLNFVEINTSFYRDHGGNTYKKWSNSVPDNFRFSVKLNKEFSHVNKLLNIEESRLESVLSSIKELGSKLFVILIQIPPSLQFFDSAEIFFAQIRKFYSGHIALEPRNITWNSQQAKAMMKKHKISEVTADPNPMKKNKSKKIKKNNSADVNENEIPDANDDNENNNIDIDNDDNNSTIRYYRLHGSPDIYKSSYSLESLTKWVSLIRSGRGEFCVIFDNTQYGFATTNAIDMGKLLNEK